MSSGANIGLQAADYVGVDIDIPDPALLWLVNLVHDAATLMLGWAPSRVGSPPKRLLMFRSTQPIRRRRIVFAPTGPRGKPHMVEILGAGQQFVVAGRHPCGRPYTWDRDPREIGPEGLTEVDDEKVTAFCRVVAHELVRLGFKLLADDSGRGAAGRAARGDVDQNELKIDDLDLVERAVEATPNDNESHPDRSSYIRMGHAIRAAFQDDEGRGLQVWRGWALRWPGNPGNPEGNTEKCVEDDWDTFKGPYAIGARYLLNLARRHGFEEAGTWLDPGEARGRRRPRPPGDAGRGRVVARGRPAQGRAHAGLAEEERPGSVRRGARHPGADRRLGRRRGCRTVSMRPAWRRSRRGPPTRSGVTPGGSPRRSSAMSYPSSTPPSRPGTSPVGSTSSRPSPSWARRS